MQRQDDDTQRTFRKVLLTDLFKSESGKTPQTLEQVIKPMVLGENVEQVEAKLKGARLLSVLRGENKEEKCEVSSTSAVSVVVSPLAAQLLRDLFAQGDQVAAHTPNQANNS